MLHILLLTLLFANTSNNTAMSVNNTHQLLSNPNVSGYRRTPAVLGNFTGSFSGNFTIVQEAQQNIAKSSTGVLSDILGVVFGSRNAAFNILVTYKYSALFILMTADASGLPPPSEFIMPPAGYLSRLGYFNFGLAFWFIMVANIIGMSIDYTIAYQAGEALFYRHKALLSDQKKYLSTFKKAFTMYGSFTIFVARLIPILRTAVNFISGLLRVPPQEYYPASIMGALVYNYVLMTLGYVFVSESFSTFIVVMIFGFPVIAYLAFYFLKRKVDSK